MAGSGSGPLGLLFMIAPLAAIPVFVFAELPQLPFLSASPGIADSAEADGVDWSDSPGTDDAHPEPEPRRVYTPRPDATEPVPQRPGYAASTPAGRGSKPVRDTPSNHWLPPADALDQWQEAKPQPAPRRPGHPGAPPAESGPDAGSDDNGDGGLPDNFDGGVFGTAPSPDSRPIPDRKTRGAGDSPKPSRPAPLRDGSGGKPLAGRMPESGPARTALPGAAGEQAGWPLLSQRLKELGIRQYRLVSHVDDGTFLFLATVPSADNPQVENRFEAEGETPLEAVQAALEQIEKWRERLPLADKGAAADNVGQ